jgi:hypothetical protein
MEKIEIFWNTKHELLSKTKNRTRLLLTSFLTMSKPRFFLYRLQTDAGSAPNVHGDVCTLALCKPMIRRSAKVGDYIIGLRGRSGEIGKLGPHAVDSVLYVMRVTRKMTMAEYDAYCTAELPVKIPAPENEFLGDCQYTTAGAQRLGPHSPVHAERDLGGKFVLLGDTARANYWYRRDPVGVRLPADLADEWDVSSVARGHRVKAYNAKTETRLHEWLETFTTAAPIAA